MSDISLGVKSFFEAIEIIRKHKDVRHLSLIPIFLCLFFLTLGLGLGIAFVDDAFVIFAKDWMLNLNPFLKALVYIFSVMIYFIFLYFLVFLLVSIIAIPVCEKIAAKVFFYKLGKSDKDQSVKEKIKFLFKMFSASIAKLFIVITVGIFILIGSFIPFLYPIALFLTFLMITWDCMDYAFESEAWDFKKRIVFIKQNFLSFSGLSLCIGLLIFIPFIHFLLLPVAVISSTCLFINIRNKSEVSI